MKLITPLLLLWMLVSTNLHVGGQEPSDAPVASSPVTAALIGVAEKGEPVKGMGEQVNALLFSLLSTNNDLMLSNARNLMSRVIACEFMKTASFHVRILKLERPRSWMNCS